MSSVIEIVIAQPADYLLLADLGRFTFYESWIHVNTEEDMQLYLAEAFVPEKIKKDLEDKGNTFLLAYYNLEAIGYVRMRTGTDRTYDEFKNASVIEMERIYVKHQYHGIKAGKALMDKSIEISRSKKCEWLWLGVNKENNKAIDFYKKYGFTIFGTKSFKLGNAMDEDFLMKMKL